MIVCFTNIKKDCGDTACAENINHVNLQQFYIIFELPAYIEIEIYVLICGCLFVQF